MTDMPNTRFEDTEGLFEPLNMDHLESISSYQGDNEGEQFGKLVRPQVATLLKSIGLDKLYVRGEGDYLYYTNQKTGEEEKVLDLVGGFGASLLGHNHPALIARAQELLAEQRPFNSQGSNRKFAGLLAEKLADVLYQSTECRYMTTFANTGAEAVEAAIKHAELEAMMRIDAVFERFDRNLNKIKLGLRVGEIVLTDDLLDTAAQQFGLTSFDGIEALVAEIYRYNRSILLSPPSFLAVEGAFHGKKTGALKLTYQREYREPWQRFGIQVKFLPRNKPEAVQKILEESWIEYYDLEVDDQQCIRLIRRKWCTITACFAEPIQGEGGVLELDEGYWKALRKAADQGLFPLIIDEIQTGMGRTGRFLASRFSNVVGDYYLFSKALGGGLAKLSAMMVKKSRYIEDFGSLHTSTFTDDDFSCSIALGAVELLTRNDHQLINACYTKGQYLQNKLNQLMVSFPQTIKAIRGRGLMAGIEFGSQDHSPSPLIQELSRQKKLGYALCGHMLNIENIRLAPTLSSLNTLRIQPSVYITLQEIDDAIAAFSRALTLIESADCYRLFGYLAEVTHYQNFDPQSVPNTVVQGAVVQSTDVRVAFLGHFLEPSDLLSWEPRLGPLTEAQCQALLDKTRHILDPFIVKQDIVYSTQGRCATAITIGIPASSNQYAEALRNADTAWLQTLIEKGVTLSKRLGCSVVGFGGYNSIITNNCTTLMEEQIALTTGNSLTSAAAIEAVLAALEHQNIPIAEAKLGIVGSIGNIGKVVAEICADKVNKLLLIGRRGSARRLNKVAEAIYTRAFNLVIADPDCLEGIAAAIADTATIKQLRSSLINKQNIGKQIREGLLKELGGETPIQTSENFEDLCQCDAIVSATNAPQPIIKAEHIGERTKVVCDVALPKDVDDEVAQQFPDLMVLKGGLTKLGLDQHLSIPGMPHSDGYIFACLGETVLLGLSGIREHFSYGALETAKVRSIAQLAKLHGYTFNIKLANE